MDDTNAEIVAKEQLYAEGKLTNKIDEQGTLNVLNAELAEGTNAENSNIHLVDNLTETRGYDPTTGEISGSTNISAEDKPIYLGTTDNAQDNRVNTMINEITNANGQGEASSTVMGNIGELVYDAGSWANSGDIAEVKTEVFTPAVIETINTAHTQEEQDAMLAENTKKLEDEQAKGDEFRNSRRGRVINRQQQLRRDIITLETGVIRRHLPNFNGIPSFRPANGNISQNEVLEYQAFSRFLQSSGQRYSDFRSAYREFRRETVNRPVYSLEPVRGLGLKNPLEIPWRSIRPTVQPPERRHKIDSIGGRRIQSKKVNTVVSSRVNMEHDVLLIRLGGGQPKRGENGEMQIEINGRTYQTHAGGNKDTSTRLIPVSSRNPNEFFRLNKGEYKNLQEIIRSGGNVNQAHRNMSNRDDFNQRDFNKAVEVYNATR